MTDLDHPNNTSNAFEDAEDVATNISENPTMGEIIAARYSRRGIMKGALAATAITATVSPLALVAADKAKADDSASFTFEEVTAGSDDNHHVAAGYDADILIRWGDPVLADGEEFDPLNQTADKQAKQFGYNNDFLGYVPHPDADDAGAHGVLVVHHEYTNEELMFPGLGRQDRVPEGQEKFAGMTLELVNIEMMAHGGSVLEIKKTDGKWDVVKDSPLNRRITAETEMSISGPAAGHDRLKTADDSTGTKVKGTINNCAGAITPWNTWIMAEENFNGYFWGKIGEDHAEFRNYKRLGLPGQWYAWGKYHDRFNVEKEANEANRFGWLVEVDPLDPNSTPVKRTALGRAKHEGAGLIVNGDGRVAVYSGDDQRFDYVYKFVTSGTYNGDDRAANFGLLDEGTLYAARFDEGGTVTWLPLVHGQGPLTAENGFNSQADVVIETRFAADLMGATKMDRPEDIDVNPKTGKVYVMLTNNTRRKPGDENPANPRAENAFGHIIEITPKDGDHAAETAGWDILVKCGDPSVADVGATFHADTTKDGWFGMPDNCAIDNQGRLWISTDGNSEKKTGRTDGVWSMETDGELRGLSRHFYRVPVGAELCGPYFTPDDETLFVAVQHPADRSTYDEPSSRWPDFDDSLPPRPSVVAITKQGGGKIG